MKGIQDSFFFKKSLDKNDNKYIEKIYEEIFDHFKSIYL